MFEYVCVYVFEYVNVCAYTCDCVSINVWSSFKVFLQMLFQTCHAYMLTPTSNLSLGMINRCLPYNNP